ncbi:NUDIX domain-containing protein [Streptomyces sp. bgisy091]|uniref:NUDIX domain-containing protein n=1 Tax=Streptomyces sp. bgisy091 TaxID=3413778 RepID=UPI003D70C5AC
MDTTRKRSSRPTAAASSRAARRTARQALAAVTLLPRGAAALAMAVAGREGSVHALLKSDPAATGQRTSRPGRTRMAALAGATALLGALSLVLTAVLLMAVARGPFYGLVDQGPYDHSWGGPGRTGAWLAHLAVAAPVSIAAIAALYGVAGLQRRLTAPLRGERRARWVMPSVLVCCAAGALFAVAFTRQLP